MTHPSFTVLFLCTTNAARSILAEAQMNALGRDKFTAYSAGSQPAAEVDPLVTEFLSKVGLPTEGLRSKSWNMFAAPDAPAIDYVITLCDDAAGEVIPDWPGHPISAHWSLPDPLKAGLTPDQRRVAIKQTAAALQKRIELLMALPTQTLDRMSLQAHVEGIGQGEGG